jgi:hypothetical protein
MSEDYKFCMGCGTQNSSRVLTCRVCNGHTWSTYSVTQMSCGLKDCPNDGVWEYDGIDDIRGVQVLCETHYRQRKKQGKVFDDEWTNSLLEAARSVNT